MNPYAHNTFGQFFITALQRVFQFLPVDQWQIDEIQIAVLSLIGLCSAIVGSWLVVRRMAMVANALSHTLLLGVVAAYLILGSVSFYTPLGMLILLGCCLVVGLFTSGMIEWLARAMRLSEDSAIGLTFSALFSIGVVAITLLTRDSHIGTEIVMGQVDALHVDDVRQVAWITLLNLLMGVLFYRGYLLTSFDVALARAQGFSPAWFGRLLMIQTTLTCVGAFRAVGVVVVVGLLIVPPLTARLWTHRFLPMMGLAAAIAVVTSVIGVALSRHLLTAYNLPLSTSGIVISLLAVGYVSSRVIQNVHPRYRSAHAADCIAR
jgi:manganese/zinc/iron transport system permease protein